MAKLGFKIVAAAIVDFYNIYVKFFTSHLTNFPQRLTFIGSLGSKVKYIANFKISAQAIGNFYSDGKFPAVFGLRWPQNWVMWANCRKVTSSPEDAMAQLQVMTDKETKNENV